MSEHMVHKHLAERDLIRDAERLGVNTSTSIWRDQVKEARWDEWCRKQPCVRCHKRSVRQDRNVCDACVEARRARDLVWDRYWASLPERSARKVHVSPARARYAELSGADMGSDVDVFRHAYDEVI